MKLLCKNYKVLVILSKNPMIQEQKFQILKCFKTYIYFMQSQLNLGTQSGAYLWGGPAAPSTEIRKYL